MRPLGVRGEPLHAAHEQIRGVLRRRLSERHARLLAEPQPEGAGRRIDWYSESEGLVTPLSALPPGERAAALSEVEALARDIEGLGARLAETSSEDARLLARALALAVRRPSDDYVFLVGDQPVVVCWGYEAEGAGAIVSAPTVPAAVSSTAAPAAAPVAAAVVAPAIVRRGAIWPALLVGLLGILLVLGAAYWLRQVVPVEPDVAVRQLPPVPPPPAPPAPPDPAIGLSRDLGEAQQAAERLKATLASLRETFATRHAACRPPEPPKPPPAPPPPVVEKKPDPPKPPPKPPQVVEKKPDPPRPPDDGRLRLPKAPTTDLSFLQGCWRTDPFRHHPQQPGPGVSEYCFDANGRGSFVFRRAGMTCRTAAQGRYEGTVLRLRDADTTCSDGTTWYQDRLDCTVGADNVAVCRGEASSGLFGGLSRWTVNLHRVR
ncbi:MAG: hypothetical protein KIT67_22650 [Alphaproteobacteria bacterium]|nr:hypothetical protein [Alphaproteobacteria bacterium]